MAACPAKATRSGRGSVIVAFGALARACAAGRARALLSRNAFLALFVQFLTDLVALEVGQVVDEQLALEMIHLVLHAHRQHAFEVALEMAPVRSCARNRTRAARCTSSKMPGNERHPSSVFAAPSRARISGLMKDVGLGTVFRHVDDDEALMDIDLGRGQPDAGCLVHGLEHVIDELP